MRFLPTSVRIQARVFEYDHQPIFRAIYIAEWSGILSIPFYLLFSGTYLRPVAEPLQ
jgi:hypothetical protein